MKSKYPFNSALQSLDNQPHGEYEEVEYYENERGVVFVHDMYKPYTEKELEIIRKADVVYAHPPTTVGMNVFAERAGVDRNGTWKEFLLAIRKMVLELNKPTWILSSVADSGILKPDRLRHIKLYDHKSTMAVWNDDGNYENIEQLTQGLQERYNSAYDFSCGYGSNVREFKYMIGSDIDKKCLGYIKQEILGGNNEQNHNTRHNAQQS